MAKKFSRINIENSRHLEETITGNIDAKNKSYYLIVNDWDDPCKFFLDSLDKNLGEANVVYTVNTYDVPNVLGTFRYCVKSHKETLPIGCFANYSNLPMLVIMHKEFPEVVHYNGVIANELRI